MAEKTQEKATGELLLAGTIAEEQLAAFIRAYSKDTLTDVPPATLLMLLEEQLHRTIKPDERQNLLYFALFNPDFDFANYTSGRIFHAQGELRWERQFPGVQIVYTGSSQYGPQLQNAMKKQLDDYTFEDREYFLFGKRLDEKQVEAMRPLAQAGDFAEVRIPRLLRYPPLPSLGEAERVQLVICEYTDTATGFNVAYRFKSLVPFSKPSKTTGAKA